MQEARKEAGLWSGKDQNIRIAHVAQSRPCARHGTRLHIPGCIYVTSFSPNSTRLISAK